MLIHGISGKSLKQTVVVVDSKGRAGSVVVNEQKLVPFTTELSSENVLERLRGLERIAIESSDKYIDKFVMVSLHNIYTIIPK